VNSARIAFAPGRLYPIPRFELERGQRGATKEREFFMGDQASAIDGHFAGKLPDVRAIYDRILGALGQLGPIGEEPKKTSIHLTNRTTFAGVATRRIALILTIKSATDIPSPRVHKREQTSANRWHLEVRLESPDEVDRELVGWLRTAYDLAG
jgi:uncharacterized protein DUF5655